MPVTPGDVADSVTISFPGDLSPWGRHQVQTPHMRAYLRKTLEEVTVGEMREVFVGVGCCGNTLDVPLRIERVDGGVCVTDGTTIRFRERAACDLRGGWHVQSQGAPE